MAWRLSLRTVLARVALAYLLVAQLLLSGAAMAQHAAATLAGETHILCSGDGSGTGGEEAHDLLCCVMGCGAAVQPALDVPGAAFAPPPLRAADVRFRTPSAAAIMAAPRPPFHATGPPARA